MRNDARQQCAADVQTPTRVLSSASLVLSAIVTLYRAWKHRQSSAATTPIMTHSCALAGIVSLAMLLNSSVDEEEEVSFCRVKGLLFQTAATAMIWQWVFNTVALHLMVVRNLPPSHLVECIPSYLVFAVPSILLSIALSKNRFGLDEAMSFCWIPDNMQRFAFFYLQILLGVVVFLALMPSVLMNVITHGSAGFFVEVVQTLYLGLSFVVLLWDALNAVVVPESAFLQATIYSSCALHHLHWSTFGVVLSALGLLRPSSSAGNAPAQAKIEPNYSSNGEGVQSSGLIGTASPTSRAASSATHHYFPASGDIPPSATMSSGSSQRRSTPTNAVQSQPLAPPRDDTHHHHHLAYDMSSRMAPFKLNPFSNALFHPTDDLCKSAYDSTCETALSVPPDTVRRLEQERAMEAYTHMLLGYVREQLQDEGYDVSSRQMSTFMSTLERSILPATRDGSLNKSILDSKKLNQMLVEYRRENQASFVQTSGTDDDQTSFGGGNHLMDVDERLNKAMERLHRDLPATAAASSRSAVDLDARLAAAKSVFEQHHDKPAPPALFPRKNVSFAGSANMDLDMRLAAAKAMYHDAPSSRCSDDDDESVQSSSFALDTDGDLDAQMEAARARWLAAEARCEGDRA